MTKPVKRYDCTSGGSSYCYGCYTMSETEYGDYVSAEDYDELLAERDELRAALDTLDRLASARLAENEVLHRDAMRYRWLRDAGSPEVYLHNLAGIDNCKQIAGDGMDAAIDAALSQQAKP